MKRPESPPTDPGRVLALRSSKLGALLAEAVRSEADGKYRHWDKLRHITPPPNFTPGAMVGRDQTCPSRSPQGTALA